MIRKVFNENELSFAVSVVLACIIFSVTASAATITVDDSGGANYAKIQDAVNAANAGDTILVYSGKYNENVNINKQLTLKGVDDSGGKPIIETPIDVNVYLSADGIILDGFNIVNGKNLYGFLWGTGIWVISNSNVIINNTISNNEHAGIIMIYVRNNTISNNIISNNTEFGIHLYRENDNKIYNNIFKNSLNVMTWSSPGGYFNTAKTSGLNIAGGSFLGGNFWANPSGLGFSQNCPDADSDGICDSSYSIDSVNIDQFPLTYKPVTDEIFDDFDDNSINPSLWGSYVLGPGPSINEVNQRLEITFPANSSNDPSRGVFAGGYSSTCSMRGDFDLEVDYELLEWPFSNGVRVGLGTLGVTERVSFGSLSDYGNYPRDVYLTHFANGVNGITNKNDLSGKLRTVRKGTALTGYYYSSGNWVPIHTYASASTIDSFFSVSSWSHDYAFTDQNVKIAFDNIVINKGKLVCPDTTPPSTIASLIGTEGLNGWYTSNVEAVLTATDNPGGTGISRVQYSFDGIFWETYGSQILISEEGTHTLYYRSMDKAQNFETPNVLVIRIDKTPPVIQGLIATTPKFEHWYNTDVLVKFPTSDAISGIESVTPDKVISTEGSSQSVSGTAIDKAGNSADTTVSGINIDKSHPVITIDVPANQNEYLLNQAVIAQWSAIDNLSGVAQATGTVPDGSQIDTGMVGKNSFTVNASDNVGHTANEKVDYYVRYVYSGILEPINENGTSIFNSNKNSIVPVKFQLQDSSGNFVPGAVAHINWSKINNNITGTINEDVVIGNTSQGSTFAYNGTSKEYFFNIITLDLVSGTWLISIKLDDGTWKYANISVK